MADELADRLEARAADSRLEPLTQAQFSEIQTLGMELVALRVCTSRGDVRLLMRSLFSVSSSTALNQEQAAKFLTEMRRLRDEAKQQQPGPLPASEIRWF